jgi:NDP-sugar pyrophosphorylase family protein
MLRDTGGAVKAARNLLGDEPFLIHNVDIISNLDIRGFVASGLDGALAKLVVSSRQSSRKLLFDEDDCLCGWLNISNGEVRGPAEQTPEMVRSILAFSGIHILSPEVFSLMESWPDKFSIIDFYLSVCTSHRLLATIPASFQLRDLGTPQAVAEFRD